MTNTPSPLANAPVVTSRPRSSTGALVTLIVVVGVIIIGALYVWGEQVAETRVTPPEESQ